MSDYISRDSVLALIQDDREVCANPTRELSFIREDINTLPAADVREVVRGKWTLGHLPSTSGGSYAVVQCSECNSQFPIWRTNFCPNCGADMREEQA